MARICCKETMAPRKEVPESSSVKHICILDIDHETETTPCQCACGYEWIAD